MKQVDSNFQADSIWGTVLSHNAWCAGFQTESRGTEDKGMKFNGVLIGLACSCWGLVCAAQAQTYLSAHNGGMATSVVPASFGACSDGSCNGGCEPACQSACSTGCSSCGSTLACECNLGEAWSLGDCLGIGECSGFTIGGWLQKGYHNRNNGLFNSHADNYHLQQAWLYAERVAESDGCNWDWGFRADIMYGTDAQDTQAFGNNPGEWDYQNGFGTDGTRFGAYGWAIPQLYGEVACGDWSIKAGHFYTLVGYEVVTAPDNFFYSHAMTMYNSEPFTHTGVLSTYSGHENLEVYLGWTAGWDTGFDQLGDGSSFLGGASLTISEDLTVIYIATAGDFGWRGSDAYSHSVVVDATLTENLNYVLQSDALRSTATGEDNVGINQYLLYTVSDCLGLGARFEWWKGDNVTGFQPHNAVLPATGSFSYYEATLGANIRPHANMVIRPEVRFDWSPAADYDETIFGVDTIFTF